MIKFGSTVLSVNNPQLDDWVNRFYRPDLLNSWTRNPHAEFTRGDKLLYTTWNDLPKPKVNELVIPAGATRWGYCICLATGAQKDAIVSEIQPDPESRVNTAALTLEFGAKRLWNNNLAQGPATLNDNGILKYRMSMLAPHRITAAGAETALRGNGLDGVWLIPLVDERYFWQYADVGFMSDEPLLDTVDQHLQYVLDQLTGTIKLGKEIPTAYTGVQLSKVGNDYENAAVFLDHMCWHLGMKVVPDMQQHQSDEVSGFLVTSVAHSFTDGDNILDRNFEGELLDVNGTNTPGVISVGSPIVVSGGDHGAAGWWIPETFEWWNGEDWTTVFGEQGNGGTVDFVSNTTLRIRTNFEEDPGNAVFTQLTRDFEAMISRARNLVFAGTQNWQMGVSDDYVVHMQCQTPDRRGLALTRVVSIPQNHFPVQPAGGTGGGGDILFFTEVGRVCPPDPVPHGHIGKCEALSDGGTLEPAYTGPIGDPADDRAFIYDDILQIATAYDKDRTLGATGVAVKMIRKGETEPEWHMIALFANPDCATPPT